MENNNLDYISALSDLSEKLTTMKRKVKHGRLKIQKKKIKSQVMKKHNPTDYERENICKKARKKAHSVVANARRNISNGVREEWLTVVNPTALTLSERYDLDFMEESNGYDISINFFEKPEITPVTEGLTIGTTKTGRAKKCKAIGIAEGCFAPISTPDGQRVFSRNQRLYDEDHWECQFENQNLLDRVRTRRMLGTIGHHDKKVDDEDLAKGLVSHIVTDLEIREDEEHGRYLWGRLEIINTPAGKLLKEYYENDIPLFVSSRGGGKLIDVPGKNYKRVDKHKYYCECFDVVKEPGFLEACPKYHSESVDEELGQLEELLREIADKIPNLKIDEEQLAALKNKLCESKDAELDEDNEMPKVEVNVTADDTMEQVVDKVIQPMKDEKQDIVKSLAESVAKLTAVVEQIRNDIYENEETPAEKSVQEDSIEEDAEVAGAVHESESEEPKAEETSVEEPKADESVAEGKEEDKKDAEKGASKKEPEKKDDKEDEVKECGESKEDKKDEEEKPHGKDCDCPKCKGDKKEEIKEEVTEETEATETVEEPKAEESVAEATEEPTSGTPKEKEPVDEQWAHLDPKETVGDKAEHKAPQGKPADALKGDVYANEPAPAVSDMKKGENAPQTQDPTNKEEKPAVNGAILEEETESAPVEGDSAVTSEEEVEEIDYKAAYESEKAENEDAIRLIDETTQMFEDFGKRHREVIAESKKVQEELENKIASLELELNSYKISEKFDVTIETAKEMLSSKSYEAVEEELKEGESKKLEEETQAKANEVSESVKEETPVAKAPVSRKVYSAFATSESISKEVDTSISEGKTSVRKPFSWFN